MKNPQRLKLFRRFFGYECIRRITFTGYGQSQPPPRSIMNRKEPLKLEMHQYALY